MSDDSAHATAACVRHLDDLAKADVEGEQRLARVLRGPKLLASGLYDTGAVHGDLQRRISHSVRQQPQQSTTFWPFFGWTPLPSFKISLVTPIGSAGHGTTFRQCMREGEQTPQAQHKTLAHAVTQARFGRCEGMPHAPLRASSEPVRGCATTTATTASGATSNNSTTQRMPARPQHKLTLSYVLAAAFIT